MQSGWKTSNCGFWSPGSAQSTDLSFSDFPVSHETVYLLVVFKHLSCIVIFFKGKGKLTCYFSIFEGTCILVAKQKLSYQNLHTKFPAWPIGYYFLKTYFMWMDIFVAWMSVHHSPMEVRRATGSPGTLLISDSISTTSSPPDSHIPLLPFSTCGIEF